MCVVVVACDTGREMTVCTHCPDPAARGGGGGSGQALSWRPVYVVIENEAG